MGVGWRMAATGAKRRSTKRSPAKAAAGDPLGPIARDAIAHAAAGLGGAGRLIQWVNADAANEKAFWGTIFPKLLSYQEGEAAGGGESIDEIRWTIVEQGGVDKERGDGGA